MSPAEVAAQAEKVARLRDWGYAAEFIDKRRLQELEPEIAVDAVADDAQIVFCPEEEWVDPVLYAGAMLRAARQRYGAVVKSGVRVTGLETRGGRVVGARDAAGEVHHADLVINCTGRWSNETVRDTAPNVPLAPDRLPGVRSSPVGIDLRRPFHAPDLDVRPDGAGRLMIREDSLDDRFAALQSRTPDCEEARLALASATELLPSLAGAEVEAVRTTVRPIPADGLTTVGPTRGVDGYYVAVTHSGVTLSPALGQLVADEVLRGRERPSWSPSVRPGSRRERPGIRPDTLNAKPEGKAMTTDTTRRDLLKWTGAGAAALAAGGIPEAALAKPPFFKLYLMIFNNLQSRMIWTDLIGKQFVRLGIDVVSSYQPPSVVIARRANDTGKTHVDGGWDMYSERIYYSGLVPLPETLFHSKNVPPNGQNFYRIADKKIDKSIEKYSRAVSPEERKAAIHAFIERWYEIEPLHIVFYPEEVIITNPKLKGMDPTTYNPVFFPRPENWTIEGATGDVTATFASWQPPSPAHPDVWQRLQRGQHLRPRVQRPFRIRQLGEQEACPGAGRVGEDLGRWQDLGIYVAQGREVAQRRGIHRRGRQVHLGHRDRQGLWQRFPGAAGDRDGRQGRLQGHGRARDHRAAARAEHHVPGLRPAGDRHHAEACLPGAQARGVARPRDQHVGGHVPVKTSDGKVFEAKGGVGTGPWIPRRIRPVPEGVQVRQERELLEEDDRQRKTFYVVNIQGADAVLSAIKSGDIDAHDPMYDVGGLLDTIDPSWGTLTASNWLKWMQTCLNMNHPVFGTGVETPLGKQDPTRAAKRLTSGRP